MKIIFTLLSLVMLSTPVFADEIIVFKDAKYVVSYDATNVKQEDKIVVDSLAVEPTKLKRILSLRIKTDILDDNPSSKYAMNVYLVHKITINCYDQRWIHNAYEVYQHNKKTTEVKLTFPYQPISSSKIISGIANKHCK